MNIIRSKPASGNSQALSHSLLELNGPCVGCEGCEGLCAELIDALIVPGLILSRKRETQ